MSRSQRTAKRPRFSQRDASPGSQVQASSSRNGLQPFVQAYEADLIYDQLDIAAEVATRNVDLPESSRVRGRGLLRWQGSSRGVQEIWADRYDIIHLLDELPAPNAEGLKSSSRAGTAQPRSPTSSSSSWDDLPSDIEETFYLSDPEEIEEYEREKKREWMEALREARVKEREKEDEESKRSAPSKPSAPSWAGDDEEPPGAILTLMSHTALSLSKSPNPQVLEMRILANHASDTRFAFLKGRWKKAWEASKMEVRKAKEGDPKKKAKEEKAMGALVGGYESSEEADVESDHASGDGALDLSDGLPSEVHTVGTEERGQTIDLGDLSAKQQERRRRAEEWKRRRAEDKGNKNTL